MQLSERDFDRSGALFSVVKLRAKTDVERVQVCQMGVRVLISLAKSAEAIKVDSEGLLMLGYPWVPEELDSTAVFMAELGQVTANLGDRRIEDLINEPELQAPRLRATLEITTQWGSPLITRSRTRGIPAIRFSRAVRKQISLAASAAFPDASALHPVIAQLHSEMIAQAHPDSVKAATFTGSTISRRLQQSRSRRRAPHR